MQEQEKVRAFQTKMGFPSDLPLEDTSPLAIRHTFTTTAARLLSESKVLASIARNHGWDTQFGACAYRAHLIIEEAAEVVEELRTPKIDPARLAKELCDLIYVAIGTAVTFGIDLDATFAAVHAKNMSKDPASLAKRLETRSAQ